jgi:hypothetical protein
MDLNKVETILKDESESENVSDFELDESLRDELEPGIPPQKGIFD